MSPQHELESPIGNQQPTALVVEPVPAMARLLRFMMQDLGFRVITASTPDEALAEIEGHASEIDLVVSEFSMPEVSGPKLASFIFQRRPTVPVVLLCDQNVLYPAPITLRAAFLQKPFTRDQLAATVALLGVSVN
jgi:DNA-binding NtrC family response regulator